MFDHALVLSALPGRLRGRLAIAMEGERLSAWRDPPAGTGGLVALVQRALYGIVVSLFAAFPLPKRGGFRRSFAFAGESMDRGHGVLVFPEGRRSPDGRMGVFMRGTGLLVAGLQAPVVPVRIDGLFELRDRWPLPARPGSVAVTFGAPVRYEGSLDPNEITSDLERRVAALGE
jgi:long-chain acyl-CoA synthetase